MLHGLGGDDVHLDHAIFARLRGQRAVGALAEPHPAVTAEKDSVLHGFGGDDVHLDRQGR